MSSLQSILITWSLVLVAGWLTTQALSYVGGLISILLTAALIAFLLNYPVNALKNLLPRTVAAVIVYLASVLVVVLLLITLLPPVINQGVQFITGFPNLLAQAQDKLTGFQVWSDEHSLPINIQLLTSQVLNRSQAIAESTATKGVSLVLGTVNRFVDFILILVISFYMLIDGDRLWKAFTSVFTPIIQQELTVSLRTNLQRFGTGQLLLGTFMAATLTVAFWVLQVPFFLLFAMFIGVMEVIPFVGATLGIGAVVLVVLFIDWWLALKVLMVSLIVQQVKDNVITPKLMGELTGLSPVFIFISLLLGAKIGGLLGIILAIPFTGVVKSFVEVISKPTSPPQTGSFFQNPLTLKDTSNALVVNQEIVTSQKI
ncbi:AI-2E family transporter [Leptolyngbya sp. Cla-17]|uniref:AI-2E family transporter n=1 Tax=Leptolyngbya sp. Cla-17 TaxID=2803751 RepID=UPI0018D5C932|nr:AI-2E family transporter [Leptolyngbya sp. Cla-17]